MTSQTFNFQAKIECFESRFVQNVQKLIRYSDGADGAILTELPPQKIHVYPVRIAQLVAR